MIRAPRPSFVGIGFTAQMGGTLRCSAVPRKVPRNSLHLINFHSSPAALRSVPISLSAALPLSPRETNSHMYKPSSWARAHAVCCMFVSEQTSLCDRTNKWLESHLQHGERELRVRRNYLRLQFWIQFRSTRTRCAQERSKSGKKLLVLGNINSSCRPSAVFSHNISLSLSDSHRASPHVTFKRQTRSRFHLSFHLKTPSVFSEANTIHSHTANYNVPNK